MNEQVSLLIDAFVNDRNIDPSGHYVPQGHVERRVTFTLKFADDDAILEAIFAGERGRPLMVWEVTRDDLNLSPDRAMALAKAIYEGHYGVEDHNCPVRQSRLTGQLNVEPYWETIISEKFVTGA